MEFLNVDLDEQNIIINKYLKYLSISFGFICGTFIFSAQLNLPYWIFWTGFILSIILPIIFHYCDKRTNLYQNKSLNKFFGPIAIYNIYSLLLTLITLNVIWALRWLSGPYTVVTKIYGVSEEETYKMKRCGITNPLVQKTVTCKYVLSSFLANPLGLYIHCIGGVLALGLGPFQLWKSFRKNHKKLHKIIGYFYIFGVILGFIGSVILILRTTNGASVACAFGVLALYWSLSISRALMEVKDGNIEKHQNWMTRNYFLTFGAVPFRFIPLMFHSLGMNKILAYDLGSWLTIFIVIVSSEIYIKKIR